jgi:hypothetical protein
MLVHCFPFVSMVRHTVVVPYLVSKLFLSIDKDIKDGDECGGLGAVGLSLNSIGQINTKGLSDALNGD